jgi:hypothetical protein
MPWRVRAARKDGERDDVVLLTMLNRKDVKRMWAVPTLGRVSRAGSEDEEY